MTQDAECTTIRMRPLIRYLGAFTGVVASLPSVLGCFYWLFHPVEAIKDPISTLFCFGLGIPLSWLTYRCLTIRGEVNHHKVYLRGLLRTVQVPLDRVAKIRKTRFEGRNLTDGGFDKWVTWRYVLHDYEDKELGRVPRSLEWCPGWPKFYERLCQLINDRRVHTFSGDAKSDPTGGSAANEL